MVAGLELDQAHAQAQCAAALAQQIRNPTLLWRTHGLLGDILERMGRPDEARTAFAASAAVIQGITSGLEDLQLRHSLERSSAVRAILERHVVS